MQTELGVVSELTRFRLFQGCHINHEAVFHVALDQAFVGFVDFLDGNEFDVAGDVVFTAKIEHLLGFANAANQRAGELTPAKDQD